jgi:hypothetical protein
MSGGVDTPRVKTNEVATLAGYDALNGAEADERFVILKSVLHYNTHRVTNGIVRRKRA